MKKKLLFINGHLNTGGVEKALLDILLHLDYDRYEVDLLLLETLGDYSNQLPPQVNVQLKSLENTYGALGKCILRCFHQRDWFNLKMRLIFLGMKFLGQKHIARARNLLTDGKHYDCAVGFRTGICTQIAAFAVNADRRITWWHHGEMNVEPASYLELAQRCDRIAVVSDPCRLMLADNFPQLADRMMTISNMLDVDTVHRKACAFNPYPNKDILHIVSIGRLAPEKHFENAIFAAKQLKDRGVEFSWHVVGDGPLHEELEQRAQKAEVTDCFIFEGNQTNPYPYLKYVDLFVHPSYVESFGIVIAEALALGVPCVVTKSAGPREFIEDGINGLLTEQSAESLTEKVIQILEDQELYNRIKANAHCPEQFLSERVMAKIDALLEEIT